MISFKKILYYFIKRKSEKEHRKYYIHKNRFYIKRYELCNQKKKKNIIKKEIDELWKYWKVYPIQYYRYNMYKSDCSLTLSEMKNYIPDFFAYYLLYPKSFKERNVLCEDKMLFYSICKGLNINQPQILFSTKEKQLLTEYQDVIDIEQAYNTIIESNAEKFFCKPTFGVGGNGIKIFNKIGNTYINNKENSILDIEYIRYLSTQDYIIQKGLIQHAIINEIYPSSINTFRIVTEYENNFNVKILFALFRMGSNGMEIDNASLGGLYTQIDILTGKFNKYAVTNEQKEFTFHPDTNFRFEGHYITAWNEILEFTKSVALKFRDIKYVGWDIAYTIDGPVLIEANNGPGVSILQDFYGGIREQFNIKNPKNLWYSENYGLKDL